MKYVVVVEVCEEESCEVFKLSLGEFMNSFYSVRLWFMAQIQTTHQAIDLAANNQIVFLSQKESRFPD